MHVFLECIGTIQKNNIKMLFKRLLADTTPHSKDTICSKRFFKSKMFSDGVPKEQWNNSHQNKTD